MNIKSFTYKEGEVDKQYGGIITDVNKLPLGTKFYVNNGAWFGRICQDDVSKYIKMDNDRIHRLKDGEQYLLSLSKSLSSDYEQMFNEVPL